MAADYISFVVIGKSENHQAWRWDTWSMMVPVLDPIVTATGAKVAVRSVQGADDDRKDVRFGRLGWDARSHQKWSHGSFVTQGASPKWKFCFTEIWAPSYTVCEREGKDPILFVQIENPFITLEPKRGQYNQFFHLAVPLPFLASNRVIIEQAVEQISGLLESVLVLVRVAPWNVRGDCIQSMLNNHLHYIGMYDHLVPDLSKTKAKWVAYEQRDSVLPREV